MALGGLCWNPGRALVNFNENPRLVLASEEGPGTKSRGARRHRGAPRMHRGCTEDAPKGHQSGPIHEKVCEIYKLIPQALSDKPNTYTSICCGG